MYRQVSKARRGTLAVWLMLSSSMFQSSCFRFWSSALLPPCWLLVLLSLPPTCGSKTPSSLPGDRSRSHSPQRSIFWSNNLLPSYHNLEMKGAYRYLFYHLMAKAKTFSQMFFYFLLGFLLFTHLFQSFFFLFLNICPHFYCTVFPMSQ